MLKVKSHSYEYKAPVEGSSEEEHYPCVYLNKIPKEALKGLSIGDDVKIVLIGKVKELASRESEGDADNNSMDVELRGIEVETPGEASEDDSDGSSEWAEMMEAD